MYKGVRWHERNGKWEARIFDSAAQKQVQCFIFPQSTWASTCVLCLRLRAGSHLFCNMLHSRIGASRCFLSEVPYPLCLNSMLSCMQVSLGYYEKEADAARAYDAESLRLRGPNGHINLPESRALIDRRTQDEDGGEPVYAGPPSSQALCALSCPT